MKTGCATLCTPGNFNPEGLWPRKKQKLKEGGGSELYSSIPPPLPAGIGLPRGSWIRGWRSTDKR